MSKKQKQKKEKIIYYDDNSPIADMSAVNRSGKKKPPLPPRKQSTAKEKWETYWMAVKTMFKPMLFVLGVLGVLYLLAMLIGGHLF
jgi:hypothetical protein